MRECCDAPEATIKAVRRLERKYQRDCDAQEQAKAALARAKAWGIAPEQAVKRAKSPARG